MAVQEQQAQQTTPERRTILFAVQGVGARVDVVRALLEVDDDTIALTVLGESRGRLIFDPSELRMALTP
jgi:hypothetical protein